MTDPVARENFLRFGSPDGYGNFKVSMAYPKVLMQKEYQLWVLFGFFAVMVLLIPGYFYFHLSQDERDVGGVNMENRKLFSELLDESVLGKKVPGILCQGLELEKVKVRSKAELQRLSKLKNLPLMQQSLPPLQTVSYDEKEKQIQVKPVLLLLAYMYDILDEHFDREDPLLQRDLEVILRSIPSYLDILVMLTIYLAQQFKTGQSSKRLSCKNILALIQFSQNLMQQGWRYQDPFMQLPYFEEQQCATLHREQPQLNFHSFCLLSGEERWAIF
jgi:hypothetical protein